MGLNGDRSVKRLKGESRPLQPATMRATVLASLPFVDGVAIFDEDTPFDLITTLQPDIIVKGVIIRWKILWAPILWPHAAAKQLSSQHCRAIQPACWLTVTSAAFGLLPWGNAACTITGRTGFPIRAMAGLSYSPQTPEGACKSKSARQSLTSF